MRKSTICLFALGFVVVISMAFASVGLVVSAQNANSSTTMAPSGTEKPKTRKSKQPRMTSGRCDPNQQEQTDLSGTYTGKARHGSEPAQDATLTITGNNFTMTSGTETHTGRVTAVTTCGYTAATFMMGDLTPPAPGPNPPKNLQAISVRVKKVGESLTLTSVPGEPESVSFSTSGRGMAPKKHKARAKKTEPAAPAKTTP